MNVSLWQFGVLEETVGFVLVSQPFPKMTMTMHNNHVAVLKCHGGGHSKSKSINVC